MRLIKLRTPEEHAELWINPDRLDGVEGGETYGTSRLMFGNCIIVVQEELSDVVALLQGPPPPDTYEEELAAAKRFQEKFIQRATDFKSIGDGLRATVGRRPFAGPSYPESEPSPELRANSCPSPEKLEAAIERVRARDEALKAGPKGPPGSEGFGSAAGRPVEPNLDILPAAAMERLDELERITGAMHELFTKRGRIFETDFLRCIADRRAEISDQAQCVTTTIPADEALSLGIAARRAELMDFWKWMLDRDMAIFGRVDLCDHIRDRLKLFEKGEV
jgi:hypothetical protein